MSSNEEDAPTAAQLTASWNKIKDKIDLAAVSDRVSPDDLEALDNGLIALAEPVKRKYELTVSEAHRLLHERLEVSVR